MSDGMGREFTYLSSHATNRYFIPNWGKFFVLPKSRTEFWQAKIDRNRERDLEEQRKLAEMGWHCITVWECQLKTKVREKTLQSLEYTLYHIYLEDHKVKRYEMPEEERVMAAEPDVEKE